MMIDTEKIANDCIRAINDKIRNLNNLNIIVAGKTGVGKSTLINSVFREKLASVTILCSSCIEGCNAVSTSSISVSNSFFMMLRWPVRNITRFLKVALR